MHPDPRRPLFAAALDDAIEPRDDQARAGLAVSGVAHWTAMLSVYGPEPAYEVTVYV